MTSSGPDLSHKDLEDSEEVTRQRTASVLSDTSAGKASLHEVFKADKQDLQVNILHFSKMLILSFKENLYFFLSVVMGTNTIL